ncbi:MAG TPA: Fe-Mn family superoxide dismutase [Candidatus Paceibacterota bacterium]
MKEIYTPKTFQLGELNGISSKNIEEHLKLYKGYVTNSNLVLNKIKEYETDPTGNAYVLSELHRRFAFEFGGMRNHEYYFSSLEGGAKEIKEDSNLFQKITEDGNNFSSWLENFKALAITRGVGWAMLYYDKETNKLLTQWVDEQHIGHLVSCSPILCLDMWEHAYYLDYIPADKKKYIEAFFENLNWEVVEHNYELGIKN